MRKFIFGLIIFLSTVSLNAATVVDQQYIPSKFDFFASTGPYYRAQTFTVGTSGVLTGIEVLMSGTGTSTFEIWSTSGGIPQDIPGSALASGTTSYNVSQMFVSVDVSSSNFSVNVGDVLAIVQVGGGSTGYGDWWGDQITEYSGGGAFAESNTGTWTEVASGGADYGFKTMVSLIPIPGAIWLFGSGLIGLIGFARRKKA